MIVIHNMVVTIKVLYSIARNYKNTFRTYYIILSLWRPLSFILLRIDINSKSKKKYVLCV